MKPFYDGETFEHTYSYDGSSIKEIFESSSASDYIVIDDDTFDILTNLYKEMNIEDYEFGDYPLCPSDIIKARTVPLSDVVFKMDTTDEEENTSNIQTYFRILYKDDNLYMLYVGNGLNSGVKYIDACEITYFVNDKYMVTDQTTIWMSDSVKDVHDFLKEQSDNPKYNWRDYRDGIEMERQLYLVLWYIVQVLLLNPTIIKTDLLKSSGKEKLPTQIGAMAATSNKKKSNKRKTKYVKRLYLNKDIFTSKETIIRHTMSWYVTGHWRHYPNKKVWVNGYWKGPLRHTHKNNDDGRERIIC